ncbi:MAG TPA: MerR family transcriptional regulator [Candidatus Methanoperedens sp.]|nr:MerR family transcriptional regulator [Candidatus Methanoperedens sp.]
MAIVRSFHRYRGEASLTLPRIVTILKEQLPRIAPEQTRYRVTTVPTERTIRYYAARGLVDHPLGRKGQLALYGYRHLLQILAVKYLQSHYLPLRKIKSLVENASNRDLEQLIPEHSSASWAHPGFTRDDRKVVADGVPYPLARAQPPAVPAAPAALPPAASDTTPGPADDEHDAWHRLEVGPGIELHVHAAALSGGNRERLRGALLRELGVLRGWFDGNRRD